MDMLSTILTINGDRSPFRLIKHEDGDEVVDPGLRPLKVVFDRGAHRIMFEGREIGNLQIRMKRGPDGAYRQDVIALLSDVVPKRATEAIFARLRPYEVYVMRAHEDAIIRERVVMDNMLHEIGPVDGDRVKMSYEGPDSDVHALLFPGMLSHVLGPRFTLEKSHNSLLSDTKLLCSYSEEGIVLPAFRLCTSKNDAGISWQIWGRGNRERARYGFVSDAIRAAGRVMAETASDPDLLASARSIIETLPVSAREFHVGSAVSDVRPVCSNDRARQDQRIVLWAGLTPDDEPDVHADFGDGFTVLTGFPGSRNTSMRVLHKGRPVMDDQVGFIPGIPREESVLITQGAVMAASARSPVFLKKHSQFALGVDDETLSEDRLTNRILEEFGHP